MADDTLEFRLDGQRIFTRVQGAGPVVVLLHCSASHSGQWAGLMDQLVADFTVLAPDLHGYGRSQSLPQDGQPYYAHDMAIVVELAKRFSSPLHLVGHSLGGTVALQLATNYPDMVASLTVYEPVQFSLLEEAEAPEKVEFQDISTGMTALAQSGKPRAAARLFVDFWVHEGTFDAMDAKTQTYIQGTIDRVVADWQGMWLSQPGQLRIADLAKIAMPCQIIRGGATRASTRRITEILHGQIQHSMLAEISGLGHMGPVSDPDRVNPTIVKFLQAQTRETQNA